MTDKEFTIKHYDFKYNLTYEDKERGYIKVDPYFISQQWKLGDKDDTSILFHTLKTIARFGVKNTIEREMLAMESQIKRMKELYNIK